MKTKCAWCGKEMGGKGDGDRVSHGICPRCLHKFFPKESNPPSNEDRAQDQVVVHWRATA